MPEVVIHSHTHVYAHAAQRDSCTPTSACEEVDNELITCFRFLQIGKTQKLC